MPAPDSNSTEEDGNALLLADLWRVLGYPGVDWMG